MLCGRSIVGGGRNIVTSTGKNDLTRCITHTEAVVGTAIHRIFDAWHYQVLWTCPSIRLLWYACNYVRLILYIMLHSTNLKPNCQMHCFARSQVRYEVHSWLQSIVHSRPAWLTLSRRSQVHSKYAPKYSSKYILKYTPRRALKDAPKCTRWHTSSLLDCTIPSKLTRCSQAYPQAHSQVHSLLRSMARSQPAWYTLQSTLKIHSQVHLWVPSQVHSRACSQGRSQLHSMSHSQPVRLYTPK